MDGSTNGSVAGIAIDEGYRTWYAACPCCLGVSHPDVKAALERERRQAETKQDPNGS